MFEEEPELLIDPVAFGFAFASVYAGRCLACVEFSIHTGHPGGKRAGAKEAREQGLGLCHGGW